MTGAARVFRFQPRHSSTEPFVAIDRLSQLSEWQDQLLYEHHGLQAYAIGQSYLIKTFERLRTGLGPFLHDRMAAFAVGVTPCIYRRRRARFAEWFAFVDEQIKRAVDRLRGTSPIENPTGKVIAFRRGSSRKSKAASPETIRTSVVEEPPQQEEVLTTEGDASVAAPLLEASTSPGAIAESALPEQPASPATPSPALLPEDWRPADPEIDESPVIRARWEERRRFALTNRLTQHDWGDWWQLHKSPATAVPPPDSSRSPQQPTAKLSRRRDTSGC